MEKEVSEKPNFNDDLLGGIKAAIERGENLKEAMTAFYNAGYTKKEIEDAARKYILEKRQKEANTKVSTSASSSAKTKEKKQEKTEALKKGKSQNIDLSQQTKEQPKPTNAASGLIKKTIEHSEKKDLKPLNQVVSKYEQPVKKKKHAFEPITIVLVLLLVFLVLILGSVFLFKEELVTFFNNLFG